MKRACSTSIIFGVCDVHQITFDSKVFFFFFFRYEYGAYATAVDSRRLNRVVCFRITSEIGRSKKNPKTGVATLYQLRPNLLRYTVPYSMNPYFRVLPSCTSIGAYAGLLGFERSTRKREGLVYNNYWGRGQTSSVCLSSYPLALLYNWCVG